MGNAGVSLGAGGLKHEGVEVHEELQSGMRKMASEIKREARARGEHVSGGAMLTLAKTHEGRRITATINSLASRINRQEMQFGLTPASAGRLEEGGAGLPMGASEPNGIEAALCG